MLEGYVLLALGVGILGGTYSGILGSLSVTPLEGNPVALALEALGGDKALDLWGFGIWFLAFAFWLDFATDDKFADLSGGKIID